MSIPVLAESGCCVPVATYSIHCSEGGRVGVGVGMGVGPDGLVGVGHGVAVGDGVSVGVGTGVGVGVGVDVGVYGTTVVVAHSDSTCVLPPVLVSTARSLPSAGPFPELQPYTSYSRLYQVRPVSGPQVLELTEQSLDNDRAPWVSSRTL